MNQVDFGDRLKCRAALNSVLMQHWCNPDFHVRARMRSSRADQDALPGARQTTPVILLHRLVCCGYAARASRRWLVKIHACR
jgi:hypothetical protein